jgi:hypothetical protein
MRHLGFMRPATPPASTTPPGITLLISDSTGASVPVTTDPFTPVAGLPLLVCQSSRRGAAVSPLAKAVISNSGAALGWGDVCDAVQLGSLPSAVRQSVFTALAPTPARSLTVTTTCADATFQHLVVLQLSAALGLFTNFGVDIDINGDLVLALPSGPLANSLSLLSMAAANANGAVDPPPFYANPDGYTQLYNFTKASGINGSNPIAMYVGYRQAAAGINIVTAGGTTAGSLVEIKHV